MGRRGLHRPAMAIAAAFVIVLLPARAALAWGPEAHRVIALIADQVLKRNDPAAHAKVVALLAGDKEDRLTKNDIASEATWADVLREKSEEARTATTAWHVTRLRPDNPDLAAACYGHQALPEGYPASHGPADSCSVDKIAQFATELRDPQTTPHERLAALQFLLNLVGDVHDPLLAIEQGDRGGECTALQVGAKPPVRLAAYWDQTLVREVVGPDAAAGAGRIIAAVPAAEARQWSAGNPPDWASETFAVAKGVSYAFAAAPQAGKYNFPLRPGEKEACPSVELHRVGPDYETKALVAVKVQLAKAGLRLARLLQNSVK